MEPETGLGGDRERPTEPEAVAARYARRSAYVESSRYDPMTASVYMSFQERHRALVGLLRLAKLEPVADKRVLEIGCGSGSNLLELIALGFSPRNLFGNELLPDRIAMARERLPAAVELLSGDANRLELTPSSFDVVYQSTVFTSLLDPDFQKRLASRMWEWTRPGGGVLWYDFTFDNPSNPDVRGVDLPRIRELFPDGRIEARRVTLAPPINRRVSRIHPSLYTAFNLLPFLRTHLLCWIGKR